MADDCQKLFAERRERSQKKLRELRGAVERISVLEKLPGLCIYITGSYGRMEASAESDLDLFFVHAGAEANNKMSRKHKTLLDAELIQTAETLGFPGFTDDGKYLNVHYLDDMRAEMGGREDDSLNHFTARMLLLLESRWLCNETEYKKTKDAIAQHYCRDYHEKDSRNAFFVINDILRYWRTMCVNYEHPRTEEVTDKKAVNKARLNNIKLKFSRKLICFSMVAPLVRGGQKLNSQELRRLMDLSPMERLEEAAAKAEGGDALVGKLKQNYAWFLRQTGEGKEKSRAWVGDKNNYQEARKRAADFSDNLYDLIRAGAGGQNSEMMRYLVL